MHRHPQSLRSECCRIGWACQAPQDLHAFGMASSSASRVAMLVSKTFQPLMDRQALSERDQPHVRPIQSIEHTRTRHLSMVGILVGMWVGVAVGEWVGCAVVGLRVGEWVGQGVGQGVG